MPSSKEKYSRGGMTLGFNHSYFSFSFKYSTKLFVKCCSQTELNFWTPLLAFYLIYTPTLFSFISARHEVITKEILELDTWENHWNVVTIKALMHDNYDVCLVAQLNTRDLIPPPSDLMEQ